MLSRTESGIFGSWQTGSVVPDPLFSIQEQSPATLLPPTTLRCLFTHQPPVVSVRVCVCISQLSRPPTPTSTSLFSCPPTAQHAPNPDMARFLISLFCLLGLRGTGSLTLLLPLPSLQPSLPSLSHEHSLRSLYCHLPPSSFACCWPYHVRSILPVPSLCVCLSPTVGRTTLHHPSADLSNFPHCIVGGSLVSTFFLFVTVYAYWGISKHVIYF